MNNKIRTFKFFFVLFFLLSFVVVIKQTTAVSSRAAVIDDIQSFYPNYNVYQRYYLEGYNYVTPIPSRTVLWFEKMDQWTYRMYNSDPSDPNSRCHWDQLSWWDDGYLRYVKTHDECPGHVANEIVYDPPILFLPRYWDETGQWSFSGSSKAIYYENNAVKCKGINNYTTTILGIDEIAPGVQAIHWQNNQATNWTSGRIVGKCYARYTTRWREDNWLYSSLPISGSMGVESGLKRAKGGNLDIPSDSWDIWFDDWRILPWFQ